MARDKGDDPRRRRGRGEEGPSDEDLGWLADLRGSGGRDDPFAEAPRSRRGGSDEPPTGSVPRGTPPASPAGGQGNRPVRRTPPLPPVSPAGPSSPASPPTASWQEPPTGAPTRGGLRRTPATPPAPPPMPPPAPPARGGGARPMLDWSDLTGELPASSAPARPPVTEPPARRPSELRTAAPTAAPPMPGPPPARPGPSALAAGATGMLRPGPPGAGPAAPGAGGAGPAGPKPPAAGGPLAPGDPMVTTGMIRRAELRKHMKVQQQLKSLTLVLVVLLLLAAYPVYLFAHALAADPVFAGLDKLDLPSWAAYEHADHDEGSRWCIGRCKVRTRTWLSERGPIETSPVYETALTGDGWRADTEGCPQGTADTLLSCWQKDEYRMQMQIRAPLCEAPPTRAPVPGATATEQAQPANTTPVCPGSLVTMYVFNATDYQPVLTS